MSEKMKKKIIEESSSDDDAIEQAICWSQVEKNDQRKSNHDERKQGRIHGYPGRVRVGRGPN